NALHSRLPVKTSGSVPKGDMAGVMAALKGVCVKSKVEIGEVIIKNVCGTGVDIIATRSL
ncbi:MAG: DUF1667 domain-containing protein, partial [Oscillospiraceae bacterium]